MDNWLDEVCVSTADFSTTKVLKMLQYLRGDEKKKVCASGPFIQKRIDTLELQKVQRRAARLKKGPASVWEITEEAKTEKEMTEWKSMTEICKIIKQQ